MTNTLDEVGIDISTLEVVQSLFRDKADPWALECLANWIDVTVNHQRTFYALPKPLARLPIDQILPGVLQEAERHGLLLPASDQPSADEIELSPEEVERLYQVFEAWASTNLQTLKEWLVFTSQVPRIRQNEFIDAGDLNRWIRDHFWNKRPRGWLVTAEKVHGIWQDQQKFAFDMVVRAAQYHTAFGVNRAYQPHPIRALYSPTPPVSKKTDEISWGWLVIREIQRSNGKWDSQRLIGTINDLQGHIQDKEATASQLTSDDPMTRREKVNQVARALEIDILPEAVKSWIDWLSKGTGVSIEVAAKLHQIDIPFLGIAWEIVSIPVKRIAASAVQRLPYVQRRVEFPGTVSDRLSTKAIQRQFH